MKNGEWRVKNEKREKGGRISEGNTAFLAQREAVTLKLAKRYQNSLSA